MSAGDLSRWLLKAEGVASGFESRMGWTITAFNAKYGTACKRWSDVRAAIIKIRKEGTK